MRYKIHKVYSPVVKDIICKYLNSCGLYTLTEERQDTVVEALQPIRLPNKDVYYRSLFYEGEIKHGWIGEWPPTFMDVHVPTQKAKFLEKYRGHILKFWVISGDLKRAWEIDSVFIDNKFLTYIPSTRYASGEYFFCVPLEHCKLLNLEGQ